jgi:hypothetical protein
VSPSFINQSMVGILYVLQETVVSCFVASAAGITVVTLVVNNPNVEEDCKNLFPGEVSINRSHVQRSGPNSLSGFVHRQPDL